MQVQYNNHASDAYRLYENIFKYSPFAISLRDEKSDTFVEVNNEFELLFGYSKAEIIGKNRFTIRRDENLIRSMRKHKELLFSDLNSYSSIVKYYRKDGSHFWGQITRSLIKNGEDNYIMSSIIDVTKQKEAEQKLLKSEYQYKQLFDHSLNAIAVYDIENQHYINCNIPFSNTYGYEIQDLKNISALDLAWEDIDGQDPIYQQRYHENIERLKKNETISFESIHKSKSGEKIIVEVVLIPYYIGDKLYIKQVTTDITEQVEARAALDQKLIELKEVNQSLKKHIESNVQLENFAHIASHDLREPVRSIIGFSQVLKRHIYKDLSEDDKEFLDYIINAGKNLNNLIGDILSFSKVSNKNIMFETLDIKHLLDNILLDLHIIINKDDVNIDITPALPTAVLGHKTYLYQLFQNLIKNAVKFRKEDAPVVVKVHYEDLAKYHKFSVEDNGIGIDKEFFEKIFLIFRKLNSKEKFEGSGIGLAISKKVVELHNGSIWVESKLGEGTTFHFTIEKEIELACNCEIKIN